MKIDKKELNRAIGRRIREHRELLNLTRDGFSERLGVSPQFIAEVENGTKGISMQTLYAMCETFDVSADYLILGRSIMENVPTITIELLKDLDGDLIDFINKTIINVKQISFDKSDNKNL